MKKVETIEILHPKTSYEVALVKSVEVSEGVFNFERIGDEVINFANSTKQGITLDSLIRVLYTQALEMTGKPMREITNDECKAVKSFIMSKLKGTL